jgi:hypothetical protein
MATAKTVPFIPTLPLSSTAKVAALIAAALAENGITCDSEGEVMAEGESD